MQVYSTHCVVVRAYYISCDFVHVSMCAHVCGAYVQYMCVCMYSCVSKCVYVWCVCVCVSVCVYAHMHNDCPLVPCRVMS